MFARLTIFRISPDRVDEGTKLYKESVLPAAREQKGYRGANVMVDRKTGNAVTITLWESEKDAVENEKNRYYLEQVAKFRTFYKKPPIREGYEIVIRDLK
ncbi:MAG: hypothetical protein KAU47_06130 [Candidatus Aminicenantes bacterium]|nr:hypothetical protein [Candidatus Aminicenantes bacterium]